MTVVMMLKLIAVVVVTALVLCFCAPSDPPGKTTSLPKHPKIPSPLTSPDPKTSAPFALSYLETDPSSATPVAATVPAASKMCPGNWLWASVTFMARFSRSGSRSPVRTRGALEEIPAVQHPFLNVFELERLLYTGKTACNHADEVWPGLYLGDQEIANNHRELRRLGISHVLNASHSRWRGTPEAYVGLGIRYLGVEAHDSPAFDMSVHFQAAADFIHRALSQPGGRILVHCAVGVSRSATLVLAYLMLYHSLTLVEAIKKVKDHRGIIPNRGFLRQLLALDRRLRKRLEA
ncbi:dual specificity protein phosphatase 26 isoform X2 [Globicephala melas]|uniref:dual specificity protein phosphatase 26 isoform X2 n=1 Tax=Globicephala melas TaxID=9731 RepID=UPI00293DA161|nr:dual specificity protein phosphatase 26 isoform X2 [Globicephala melas]